MALSIAVSGCGGFEREQASTLVGDVGADRIREAAESLRPFIKAERRQQVPASSWPQALRDLKPQAVYVEKDGVWISKWTRFVEGQGLYVAFKGVKAPDERWGDPSVWGVSDGIYWYEFTG